ncbi:LysR family transcriptional regulator substrate-binding protein [Paenibacillus sp. GYB004]|uniref:LysR family transcriptional regulator substrate-binding protein n=1 Tax=Paenibacillus sp. GYB004 TaxID=2994393 RepID=UPI002F968582
MPNNRFRNCCGGGGGTIRLGVLPSDLDFLLVPLFIHFHQHFPSTQLQAISTLRIQEEVLDNTVDLGIGVRNTPDNRLTQIALRSEPYELVVNRSHPLAGRKEVKLREVEPLPLVMYPRGFLGRELVEKACREEGFHISTVMETTTASSLLQLVKANIGATIQPQSLLKRGPEQYELLAIPITDRPPVRHLELVHRSDRFISAAQKQLTGWLIEFFER